MKDIEELAEEWCESPHSDTDCHCIKDYVINSFIAGCNTGIEIGKKLANEWISVEDELPEVKIVRKSTTDSNERFLVRYDFGSVDISTFHPRVKKFAVESARCSPKRIVTHWRYIE